MKKLIAIIALASSMGVASANEPVALTDGQMDNVSAGFFFLPYAAAGADAKAYANGLTYASTNTGTYTNASVGVYCFRPYASATSWSGSSSIAN